MPTLNLLALDVGNTRTTIGRFDGRELTRTESFANDDLSAIVSAAVAFRDDTDDAADALRAVIVSTVHDAHADRISSAMTDQTGLDLYRVGRDLPVPVVCALDPETITGSDRLLNALAAFDLLGQACMVVDAGTAVTIDFVDGEGTFHGGAILPGAAMQLRALHEFTDALPELSFTAPADDVFGRNTAEAMLRGVFHGIRGAVQRLTERSAEAYGAYPLVVATGGDAQTLFEADELIDRIVPELTLRGIALAAERALASASDQ